MSEVETAILGSPDDVWIVYADERTSGGKLEAWRDGPVRELIRQKVASRAAEDAGDALP